MAERTLLKQAREDRGLKQPEIAEAIECSIDALSRWERGAIPSDYYCNKLCEFYGKRRSELGFGDDHPISEGELVMLKKKLDSLDRRDLIELLGSLSIFAGVDLSMLLNATAHEEFLDQCNAAINACWHLLKHDGSTFVDGILKVYLPRLIKMTDRPSDYQHLAASLAVQTKTLEGLLAMHRVDYGSCEIYRASGVRYGRLSGNNRLLAAALADQGDIYMDFAQYQRAILIYSKGLEVLDHNALLNKAALSSGVAYAYALDGQEEQAIEMIEQAREVMPKYPELDPFYHLIDFGLPDLDRTEGRVYLSLAKKNRDYAEKAYYAFTQGTSKQATSDRSWSQTLINKADAALALGDFRKFAQYLEYGLTIALQINSLKRKSEACTVLHKVPDTWKKERAYQDLVKMF